MNTLFKNAIESIELGIEDYQANEPKRALSAVRNFYAGTLLLAKEVLIREAPNANAKDMLAARLKLVPDGKGGAKFKAASERTIDFTEIGQRFNDFGLTIDQRALRALNRIRNDIEHNYTNASHGAVRDAIARALPVVVDLFRLAGEEPRLVLGGYWQVMLDVKTVYDKELAECRRSFDGVDWKSESLASAALICPECGSHLVERLDTKTSHHDDVNAKCRSCGVRISVEKLIETALKAHFEMENYIAVKEGGEESLFRCPECALETYVMHDEENECAWCHLSLEECARCSTSLGAHP